MCNTQVGLPCPRERFAPEQGIPVQVSKHRKFPEGKGCQGKPNTRDPIRSSSWIETQRLSHYPHPTILFLIWEALSLLRLKREHVATGQAVLCVMGTSDPESDPRCCMPAVLWAQWETLTGGCRPGGVSGSTFVVMGTGNGWCCCKAVIAESFKKHETTCFSLFPFNINVNQLVN